MLNYEPWEIDPANRIRIGNKGINASNFELSGSSITIQSQNKTMFYCYWFKDFKIETVSSMVEKRSTNQRKH
jgi:hypothetical protein